VTRWKRLPTKTGQDRSSECHHSHSLDDRTIHENSQRLLNPRRRPARGIRRQTVLREKGSGKWMSIPGGNIVRITPVTGKEKNFTGQVKRRRIIFKHLRFIPRARRLPPGRSQGRSTKMKPSSSASTVKRRRIHSPRQAVPSSRLERIARCSDHSGFFTTSTISVLRYQFTESMAAIAILSTTETLVLNWYFRSREEAD